MIKFKIGDREATLPTTREEVTLGQYVAYRKWDGKNLPQLLAILTGIPPDVWMSVRTTEVESKILPFLQLITFTDNLDDLELPKTVNIKGKDVHVPTDIENEPWGKAVSVQQIIVNKGEFDLDLLIEKMPRVIAIYLQDYYFGGDFDTTQLDEMEGYIMDLSLIEGYSLGAFFLNKSLQHIKNIHQRLTQNPMQKRDRRGFRSFRRLALSEQQKPSPVGMFLSWMQSIKLASRG